MHVDPHTSCPTLGHVTVAGLMASIRAHWTEGTALQRQAGRVFEQMDALLAQAHNGGKPLRFIADETGVPRSTAHGRLARHHARLSSEVAA